MEIVTEKDLTLCFVNLIRAAETAKAPTKETYYVERQPTVYKTNIPPIEPARILAYGNVAGPPPPPSRSCRPRARPSSELSARLRPVVRRSLAQLVRSMNCCDSNLLEGHTTHPRDSDRALLADYSRDPHRRDLQFEVLAHIEVQGMIDERAGDMPRPPALREVVEWTHREFCRRLPESLLLVENPEIMERFPVGPGKLRSRKVALGRHLAPAAEDIPAFVGRGEQAYDAMRLPKALQVIGVAAAHHRFLWIHPFLAIRARQDRVPARGV